jgi:PTS system galactitol-specific IIA component
MYAQINQRADNWEDAIRIACKPLIENGHVTTKFAELTIEREKKWPTGLPSLPVGVAIPHAETRDQIIKAEISAVVLNEPTTFKQAGNDEISVSVQLVFVLAFDDSTLQLNMIANLMECISKAENLNALLQAKTEEDFIQIYNSVRNPSTNLEHESSTRKEVKLCPVEQLR